MKVNRKVIFGVGIAGLVILGVVAFGVWNWLLGPTLEASGEITAIPIVQSASTPTTATEVAVDPIVATDPTEAPATGATTGALPTTEAIAEEAATDEASGLTVLAISQADSEVRFILTEELRGQPKTVVGASDQVAGQIAVDPNDLSTAQVGVIQVNARTLETDSSQRDRAIRNQILSTDAHEYITFTPTEVIGLSGNAAPGDTFTFQIAGMLTIRDISQPVVFEVTATVDGTAQLSGTATTKVQRADYSLIIPSVPQVANVSENVTLEIDFVATGIQYDGNAQDDFSG